MRRIIDRLNRQLGDFAPLDQPINEVKLERLIERKGIAFVLDYPQILFERRDGYQLPGWRHRDHAERRSIYTRNSYDQSLYLAGWPRPNNLPVPNDGVGLIHRMTEGDRILERLYAPVKPSAESYANSHRTSNSTSNSNSHSHRAYGGGRRSNYR